MKLRINVGSNKILNTKLVFNENNNKERERELEREREEIKRGGEMIERRDRQREREKQREERAQHKGTISLEHIFIKIWAKEVSTPHEFQVSEI